MRVEPPVSLGRPCLCGCVFPNKNMTFSLLYTTFVPKYMTLLQKPRELRKFVVVLNLYVITIVFTNLSLTEG